MFLEIPAARARCSLLLLVFSSAALWPQQAEIARKAEQARRLMMSGKPEAAIPIYRELVRAFPDDPDMLMNLCIAQFKAKDYRSAGKQAESVLRLRPDLISAKLFLGASRVEMGEYASAVAPLQSVVDAQPNERNGRLMLAEALAGLNRYSEAAVHYEKAAELAPESPKVWYGLGRAYEALAERSLEQLEKVGPESPYGRAMAADSSRRQRRYGTAIKFYTQALAMEPALPGLHAGLAEAYRLAGHPDRAKTEAERERVMPPPDCSARPLECAFRKGRYREILAAASSRSTPETLYWESKAYSELAKESYARLDGLPPSLETHLHAARTLDSEGSYVEAARRWREALKLSPDDARIQLALARSQYRGRDYEPALRLLAQLLKNNASSAELNFLHGACLLNLEQPDQAAPYLRNAIRPDPNFLPAQAALGQALLRAGKAADAIPHLKSALPVDEDGSGHYQLYRAYQLAGQVELARQALADYERFRQSVDARRRAEEDSPDARP